LPNRTIADIANIPYVVSAERAGVSIEDFPFLTTWFNRLDANSAVQKGLRKVDLSSI
jgi:glutathione S-transferase